MARNSTGETLSVMCPRQAAGLPNNLMEAVEPVVLLEYRSMRGNRKGQHKLSRIKSLTLYFLCRIIDLGAKEKVSIMPLGSYDDRACHEGTRCSCGLAAL